MARFGAVAAAGEIATQLGVVPWPAGTAQRAALECFEQWAEGFGRQGAREERQVIETVRNAIQSSLARFARVPKDRLALDDDDGHGGTSNREGEARALATLGYVHEIGMKVHYLFHDAGWSEILKGFDQKFAADVLISRGLMLAGDGGRRTRKQRIGTLLRLASTLSVPRCWNGTTAARSVKPSKASRATARPRGREAWPVNLPTRSAGTRTASSRAAA